MTAASRHTLVDYMNMAAPRDAAEGFSMFPIHERQQSDYERQLQLHENSLSGGTSRNKPKPPVPRPPPPTDFNLTSVPQPPSSKGIRSSASQPQQQQQQQQRKLPGTAKSRVNKDDVDQEDEQQATRELLAFLRSIHYSAVDQSADSTRDIPNSAAALEELPITSVYSSGRDLSDTIGLYNDRVSQPFHSYIMSRLTTGITLYPFLLGRGIRTVSQLRRISMADLDAIRHFLISSKNPNSSGAGGGENDEEASKYSSSTTNDAMGCALYSAFVAKLASEAVEPSLDGLEVQRASGRGSGCAVRCDQHHTIAVAVDRRPADVSLRWQRQKPTMNVICSICAPHTYSEDVEPRVASQPVACPRPPYLRQQQAEQRAEMLRERSRAEAGRLFEPKVNPITGHVFVPLLTTLQHSLIPQAVLPEDTDAAGGSPGGSRRVHLRLPKSVGELTGADDGGDSYDPFKCRASVLFTLDEAAVGSKILKAVKDVVAIQHHRAGGDMSQEPFVDESSPLTSATLGGAFLQMGVAPGAIAMFQGAVSRGRLGSMAGGSMRRGSVRMGGGGGTSSPLNRSNSSMRRSSSVMSSSARRPSSPGPTTPLGGTRRGAAAPGSPNAAAGLNTSRSGRFGSGRGSVAGLNRSASIVGGSGGAPKRGGITIADLASWIEQRLDGAKFLKSIFTRFSRSTPWIIFRHELDEAIRSRTTGINLILQLMDSVNADILPFERFCSEVSRGRLAVTFTEQFLADAIRFITEHQSTGLWSRKSAMGSMGGAGFMRRAGSVMSVGSAK